MQIKIDKQLIQEGVLQDIAKGTAIVGGAAAAGGHGLLGNSIKNSIHNSVLSNAKNNMDTNQDHSSLLKGMSAITGTSKGNVDSDIANKFKGALKDLNESSGSAGSTGSILMMETSATDVARNGEFQIPTIPNMDAQKDGTNNFILKQKEEHDKAVIEGNKAKAATSEKLAASRYDQASQKLGNQ